MWQTEPGSMADESKIEAFPSPKTLVITPYSRQATIILRESIIAGSCHG